MPLCVKAACLCSAKRLAHVACAAVHAEELLCAGKQTYLGYHIKTLVTQLVSLQS